MVSPTPRPAGRGPRTRSSRVFSSTKGVTAVCANLLIERGLLDPDERVAKYWPEFGAAGKDAITVRQTLSHQAGLPLVEGDFTLDEVLGWDAMVDATREAGAVVGTRDEPRLPHADVRLVRRRADPARHGTKRRAVPPRRGRGPARHRLLDRPAGGARTARRASGAPGGRHARRARTAARPAPARSRLRQPVGALQLRRHVEHACAARGRDAVLERDRRRARPRSPLRVVHRRRRRQHRHRREGPANPERHDGRRPRRPSRFGGRTR